MARNRGQSNLALGLVTIVVAITALLFVFFKIGELSDSCKVEPKPICQQLSGFTMSMIIVLLIIGGFVITIAATVFIMLSAQ